jgi:hypothetical protein
MQGPLCGRRLAMPLNGARLLSGSESFRNHATHADDTRQWNRSFPAKASLLFPFVSSEIHMVAQRIQQSVSGFDVPPAPGGIPKIDPDGGAAGRSHKDSNGDEKPVLCRVSYRNPARLRFRREVERFACNVGLYRWRNAILLVTGRPSCDQSDRSGATACTDQTCWGQCAAGVRSHPPGPVRKFFC